MTLTPEGGAAIPVSVTTTRKVQGGAAIPVYGYMTAPTDGRPAMGGSAIPVRVLTAADLKQNGGQWTLEGRPYAMPVYTAPATTTVMGGPALAVYPVNAWPTVPAAPSFVPTDIGASLLAWWKRDGTYWQDAARTTPATATGDTAAAWDDASANALHATQSTAANQPVLRIVEGKKTVYCKLDDLVTAAMTPFPSKRGAIIVGFMPRHWATQTSLVATHPAAGNVFLFYTTVSGTAYKYFDGVQHNAAALDTSSVWQVQSLHRTGDTTMEFYRNGVLADTLTVQDLQQANLAVYLGGTPAGPDFTGYFTDIIITGDITSGQRAQLENYVTGRLPSTVHEVVAFGDSVTAGSGASDAAHRWVNLTIASKQWFLMNNSGLSATPLQNSVQNAVAVLGGAVTNNGRDTYVARVGNYNPTDVWILYGLNDLRLNDAGFTVANYQNDLGEIVDALTTTYHVAASRIVIGSPPYIPAASYALDPPWDGGTAGKHAQYVTAAAAVATAKSTKYIDVYAWMAANGGDALISGDGIHPNDAGHQAIANAFLSVL